jgi:hypothetical protein
MSTCVSIMERRGRQRVSVPMAILVTSVEPHENNDSEDEAASTCRSGTVKWKLKRQSRGGALCVP